MTMRMDVGEVAPDAYKVIYGMERYVRANVDRTLLALVKLRASMVNGCAFCVDMHSTAAMEAGESAARLFGLAAWHDADLYTEEEHAALALTDAVTRLGPDGVSDEVWDAVAARFTDEQVADLLMAIALINVWNRIAIATRRPPASALTVAA